MEKQFTKAQELFKSGKLLEAARLLEALVKDNPDHWESAYLLGICRFREKKFPEAAEIFRRAVDLQTDVANSHYYLGLCKERLGDDVGAETEYKFTLALDPQHKHAAQKLGKDQTGPPQPKPLPPQGEADPGASSNPGEQLFEGRRKLRTFWHVPTLLLLLVVSVIYYQAVYGAIPFITAPGGYFFNPRGMIQPSMILFYLPVWVLLGLTVDLVLRSMVTRCTILQRRIDLQRGIIFRKNYSVWTFEIESVEYGRGLWLALVRSGTVKLKVGPEKHKLVGYGNSKFMKKMWAELRDAALVERRGMKKWWI